MVGSLAGVVCAAAAIVFGIIPFVQARHDRRAQQSAVDGSSADGGVGAENSRAAARVVAHVMQQGTAVRDRQIRHIDIDLTLQDPLEALAQLPPRTEGFTGRDDEMAVLTGVLDPASTAGDVAIVAVVGPPGVGKTALAIQAAHAAHDRGWYSGGFLFIDLHGYDERPTEPGQALHALLSALAVSVEQIPQNVEARAALYRSVLARVKNPVLLIVDNASSEAQVRPLLSGSGQHKTVVTSRHTLAGLGARLIETKVLADAAGVVLLDAALRVARPNDDRISADQRSAERLARACGGLPLALQIAAALLRVAPFRSVGDLADELADRLGQFVYDDGSGPDGRSVAVAFRLSYRRLDSTAARVFRLLALNPGPDFSAVGAAVLADLPASRVRAVLADLAKAHLIEAPQGPAVRWRMHDLLRLYAQQLSEQHAVVDDAEKARGRIRAYYEELSQVFIGRADEMSRFAALLSQLQATRRDRGGRRGRGRPHSEASPVVLVHGVGGSGKSLLLRQFRALAEGKGSRWQAPRHQVRTAWIDWEEEQHQDPGSYTDVSGPSFVTVLNVLQMAIIHGAGEDRKARERAQRAFAGYRDLAVRMPEYVARFTRITQLWPLESSSAGAESARVEDLSQELTSQLASAIRAVADRTPLVVFMDSAEVLGAAPWARLREVVTSTGRQVIWVVSGRFELESEDIGVSPVVHLVRDHAGTADLLLMSPDRLDYTMIAEYLKRRTDGWNFTAEQVAQVARFTRGLPLAVSLTVELLLQGADVEEVCRRVEDGRPNTIVTMLARRYLVHTEGHAFPPGDPRRDDLANISALALARGDLRSDPELLAVLWDVSDPLTSLKALAERHDFVLPVSFQLHEDVRDALLTYMLDPYQRAGVREINRRALDLYTARLDQMRRLWPSRNEQARQAQFMASLQAALWHSLWIDNQAGISFLKEILTVLAIADTEIADATIAMVTDFTGTFDDDQRRELERLIQEIRPVNGEAGRTN